MKSMLVQHDRGEYEIAIGRGVLERESSFSLLLHRPVVIVTDETVAPLWLEQLRLRLPQASALVLPTGEATKTLSTVNGIWEQLARAGIGRDGVLVGLGGGVIGDMTGFAAACWMRGVDFVQVPTTLLAQVDASIGGKTAVDLAAGKNLVGAFHQPLAVLIDTATLDTLPDRYLSAGLAEVAKTALLSGMAFFETLERDAERHLRRDEARLADVIARCCEIKSNIVNKDERERGERALLNLGHTFAHALETLTGYRRFLHGEAVAIGLVLACRLSEHACGLDPNVRVRLVRLLETFKLPAGLPADVSIEDMLRHMQLDKKHTASAWRLVLLESVGHALVREFPDASLIRAALQPA